MIDILKRRLSLGSTRFCLFEILIWTFFGWLKFELGKVGIIGTNWDQWHAARFALELLFVVNYISADYSNMLVIREES